MTNWQIFALVVAALFFCTKVGAITGRAYSSNPQNLAAAAIGSAIGAVLEAALLLWCGKTLFE